MRVCKLLYNDTHNRNDSGARDGFEPFIRSGKTGGWRELMSEEQAAKLQQRLEDEFTKDELEWLGEHYCS